MIEIKKILCPLDFSEPSLESLDTARGLAARFGAELTLMHSVEDVPVPPYPTLHVGAAPAAIDIAGYQKEMVEQASASLEKLAEKHASKDVQIKTHVAEGKAGEAITGFAREMGADLVVIAAHGSSGWRRFIFGSVTEKVVRTSPCPVLTLTHDQEE